jgi:methyl-accepting chemotaxis protein
MMSRLTIGKTLLIGMAALVVSLAALSVISLRMISTLGRSLDSAVNSTGKKLDLVGRTRDAFQELKHVSLRAQVTYAIGELERNSGSAGKQNCSTCHAPAPVDENAREIEAAGGVVRQHSGELRGLVSDETARKSLGAIDSGASQWVDYTKEYLRLADSNHFQDAHAVLRDKMFPIQEEVEKAATLLAQREREALSASNLRNQSEISGARWTVYVVSGFNLLVGAAVLLLVFRNVATLRQAVIGISKGVEEVAAVAAELSASSQSLASGASTQVASLEETSASSEEINSMAKRNSENSRQATSLVSSSQQQFIETNTALHELEMAMGKIDSSSAKISGIIKTIDEIAFQTNILALNAAVEAARSGEAGLGFAVVADEVRNLAQRSAQAARDTAGLIEESIDNSRQGKLKVDRVAAAIRTVGEQAGTIKRLVDEVNVGSVEQARGIEQMAKGLTQIEQVIQKTAANAEQNAAAGQELSAQSKTLEGLTEQLRVMVDG